MQPASPGRRSRRQAISAPKNSRAGRNPRRRAGCAVSRTTRPRRQWRKPRPSEPRRRRYWRWDNSGSNKNAVIAEEAKPTASCLMYGIGTPATRPRDIGVVETTSSENRPRLRAEPLQASGEHLQADDPARKRHVVVRPDDRTALVADVEVRSRSRSRVSSPQLAYLREQLTWRSLGGTRRIRKRNFGATTSLVSSWTGGRSPAGAGFRSLRPSSVILGTPRRRPRRRSRTAS